VDMGFLAVFPIFVRPAVVVTVRQGVVVMLMGMPVGAVRPLADDSSMMVSHVVVIVGVHRRVVGVFGLFPFAFGSLLCLVLGHFATSFVWTRCAQRRRHRVTPARLNHGISVTVS
jgi:hypothetical protein